VNNALFADRTYDIRYLVIIAADAETAQKPAAHPTLRDASERPVEKQETVDIGEAVLHIIPVSQPNITVERRPCQDAPFASPTSADNK
jgi:hypothetical protein